MSLVLFHYITRSKATMTDSLRVWGRRPWLLVPFLRKVRRPNRARIMRLVPAFSANSRAPQGTVGAATRPVERGIINHMGDQDGRKADYSSTENNS